MRRTSRGLVVYILSAMLLFILISVHGCYARDTITVKDGLVDGQTLVSAGNRFKLGFFTPSTSSKNGGVKRYVGIWYTSSPQTFVWVANRKDPLLDKTGVLYIADGNLKLSDKKGIIYWSADLTLKRISDPVAKLNDTGNFILLDDRSREQQWQSFDQPTDTFLFGMKMDENFALTSWKNEEDPTPGNFTFKQDPEGKNQLVVMEKSFTRWRPNRLRSDEIFRPDGTLSTMGNLLNFSGNSSFYVDKRLVMNFTGDLQYWQLDSETGNWSLIWWEPKDKCDKFNYCGNFGTCNSNSKLKCKCLPGFKPHFPDKWNAGEFSGGCYRNYISSSCGNDYFLSLKRMTVGNSVTSYQVKDVKDCRQECLNNCQCQAYSEVPLPRGDTISCLTWTEDLKNLREDQDGGYHLYVRVSRSDIGT